MSKTHINKYIKINEFYLLKFLNNNVFEKIKILF